jgi:xanthine dehydrogenase molybdenum-binding subunit
MSRTKTITFRLNGEIRHVEAPPEQSLLEVLRESFKLTSLKDGCAPQKECGCCLALIDGLPKVTCSVKVEQVEGRSILTLEGVSDNERQLYADAFQTAAGLSVCRAWCSASNI